MDAVRLETRTRDTTDRIPSLHRVSARADTVLLGQKRASALKSCALEGHAWVCLICPWLSNERCCGAGCLQDNESGFQFDVRLERPVMSATLSYFVKFDANFDFTRGGKLPGLCGEGARSAVLACHLVSVETSCTQLQGLSNGSGRLPGVSQPQQHRCTVALSRRAPTCHLLVRPSTQHW